MKKLYNLYEQIILESIDLHLAQKALDGNWGVNIVYSKKDKDGKPSKNSSNQPRWCQVLAIGKTNKGNDAIRVYQVRGPNLRPNKKTGKIERYKTFLINNIEPNGFNITKFKFYSPPDGLFNTFGDKTLNITSGDGGNIASFGDKYMDNYRTRHANWQSSLDSKQQNEPLAKKRADSAENPYTDYEYTPYEKPVTNKDDSYRNGDNQNNNVGQDSYRDDTENQDRYQDDENIETNG